MVSTENFCCSPRYSSLRLSHNRFIVHSVSSFQIGEKTFSSPLFPSIRHPGFTGVDIGLNHHGGEASRGEASRTLTNPPTLQQEKPGDMGISRWVQPYFDKRAWLGKKRTSSSRQPFIAWSFTKRELQGRRDFRGINNDRTSGTSPCARCTLLDDKQRG